MWSGSPSNSIREQYNIPENLPNPERTFLFNDLTTSFGSLHEK
jgi:hypothetical protein